MPPPNLLAFLKRRLTILSAGRKHARADAVVLIAITDEAAPRILLTRRSKSLSRNPGNIAFPGGMRDPRDETFCKTALREAWEEIRLGPDGFQYGGMLPVQRTIDGLDVIAVVGTISPSLLLMPQSSEVSEILYIPLEHLVRSAQLRRNAASTPDRRSKINFYEYPDHGISGITAGFISFLVMLLQGADR